MRRMENCSLKATIHLIVPVQPLRIALDAPVMDGQNGRLMINAVWILYSVKEGIYEQAFVSMNASTSRV